MISKGPPMLTRQAWTTLLLVAVILLLGVGMTLLAYQKHKVGRESELYMRFYKEFLENRYAVRLKEPIVLKNHAGEVVGRLEPGCILQSPSMDDCGGVDLSDNDRMKVVFDVADRPQWEEVEGLPALNGTPVSPTAPPPSAGGSM